MHMTLWKWGKGERKVMGNSQVLAWAPRHRVMYPWERRWEEAPRAAFWRLTIKFQILTALLGEDDFKNKIWLSLQFKVRACVRNLKNRRWLMPFQMTRQKRKWLQKQGNVLRFSGYINIYRSERWRGTSKILRRNHSLGCRNKEGWVFNKPKWTADHGGRPYLLGPVLLTGQLRRQIINLRLGKVAAILRSQVL